MSNRKKVSDRLLARGGGLHSRRMPGGGQAMSGPTASRALKALGARAMTMDRTIFVDERFDSSNAEDLALYAHERHHQDESGGTDDGHSAYDAEEMAARARERLVLHRARAGHNSDDIMNTLESGVAPTNANEADRVFAELDHKGTTDDGGRPDPMQAYRNMRADGKKHRQIVTDLANHCMQALDRQNEQQKARTSGDSGE